MPARRLLMRKIREVLRLKHERGLSQRAIAQACAIGVGTVTLYLKHLKRTAQQGLLAVTRPASTAPTRTWPPSTARSSSLHRRGNRGTRLP